MNLVFSQVFHEAKFCFLREISDLSQLPFSFNLQTMSLETSLSADLNFSDRAQTQANDQASNQNAKLAQSHPNRGVKLFLVTRVILMLSSHV